MSAETPQPQPGDKILVTYETRYAAGGRSLPMGQLIENVRVEVLERADDPTIGEIRAVAPSADGTPKTAVKVGSRLSENPGERCMWVIVETGEMLADGTVSGLGDVIGAVPDSPAAKAQSPARPSVRVPNEPHGLPEHIRSHLVKHAAAGNRDDAVDVLTLHTYMTEDQARDYVESMPEYRTYLAAHGTDVDPVEADRMRSLGFDRQPEFKLPDDAREQIESVLQDRMGEYFRTGGDGYRDRLNITDLSGVVADIVFAAIRRDRERRTS